LGILKTYKNPAVKKNTIYVVYQTQHGFEKVPFPVKTKSSNTSIQENYNDDFQEINKRIIKKLNNKDKTGLFIFNGEPGTGKTQYVRYLTSVINRNIIFVPPDMVNIITDPSFIPFLLNNPNCVLIIEDAESALQERNNGGRSGNISNILNMTDGLLSDCVNISIIVTFNTDFRSLDKALLRKGRLLESYEFGKLSADKAQKLMNKLGHNVKVEKPMTLSDIYFYEETNSNEKYGKKKISGFKKDE
jgi:ATP-dependent 26S proteasome regulatory subunit